MDAHAKSRRKALKVAVGALCTEVGFGMAEESALETLTEVLQSCKVTLILVLVSVRTVAFDSGFQSPCPAQLLSADLYSLCFQYHPGWRFFKKNNSNIITITLIIKWSINNFRCSCDFAYAGNYCRWNLTVDNESE